MDKNCQRSGEASGFSGRRRRDGANDQAHSGDGRGDRRSQNATAFEELENE